MAKPKTLPQDFAIPFVAAGNAACDAWLVRTDALLAAFERRLPAPDPGAPIVALGFVVMASDYLWQELREAADFTKLDVRAFTEHCGELLEGEDTLHTFIETLAGFYEFLVETESANPEFAGPIARAFRAIPATLARS